MYFPVQDSTKALSYWHFPLGHKITTLQITNPIVRLQPKMNESIAAFGVSGKPPNRTAQAVGKQGGVSLTEKGKDARAIHQLLCDPQKQERENGGAERFTHFIEVEDADSLL